MILANFNLSFFTSIPGMLITGGVLLLLIALIIFIATGSKASGKKNKEEKEEDKVTDEQVVPQTFDSINNENGINTVDVPNKIEETPAVMNVPEPISTTPTVTPSVVEAPQVNSFDNNVPLTNEVITPNNNTEEKEVIPIVNDNITNNMETPIPVISTEENNNTIKNDVTPSVINPINSDIATSEPVTIVDNTDNKEENVITPQITEEAKPIYGGSDPVIPKIEIDNNPHRPIYGGANPLENTQSIPTINNVKPVNNNINLNQTNQTNDVKVDIPTVTSTPNVVNNQMPNEVITPNVNSNIGQEKTNVIPSKAEDNSTKNEEIESLF